MSEHSRENINCYYSDRLSYSKVSVLNFEKEFRNRTLTGKDLDQLYVI